MIKELVSAAAVVAALASSAAHAADDTPTVLAPASHWQLDMAENKCRLARFFGPEEYRVLLFLEQWGPAAFLTWGVAGPAMERFRPGREIEFSFGPNGHQNELLLLDADMAEYGRLVTATSEVAGPSEAGPYHEDDERDWQASPYGLPALDAKGAAEVESLSLSQRGRDDVILQVGSMEPALTALNFCMEDLVKHWGFEPDRQREVVSPPIIKNFEKVAHRVRKTYPRAAERAGNLANFHLRLTISADAVMEDCTLLNQTIAKGFDMEKHPCAIFSKYAEFESARDAEGSPLRSYKTLQIYYRM